MFTIAIPLVFQASRLKRERATAPGVVAEVAAAVPGVSRAAAVPKAAGVLDALAVAVAAEEVALAEAAGEVAEGTAAAEEATADTGSIPRSGAAAIGAAVEQREAAAAALVKVPGAVGGNGRSAPINLIGPLDPLDFARGISG